MDPLEALRVAIARKQHLSVDPDRQICIIGDKTFPSSTPTTIKSFKGESYSLGAIVYCWLQQNLQYTEYFKEAQTRKIPTVSLVHKKAVIADLTGGSVGVSAPTPSTSDASGASSTGKHSATPSNAEPAAKRARPEPTPASASSTSSKPEVAAAIPGMTAEKLSELRKKREAVKTGVPEEALAKPADPVKAAAREERLLRTRDSVLQSQTKDFTKAFDTIRQILKADVKPGDKRKADPLVEKKKTAIRYEKTKDTSASQKPKPTTAPTAAPAPAPPQMTESEFWRSKLKGNDPLDLEINTFGGFADSGLQLNNASAENAPRANPKPAPAVVATATPVSKPITSSRPSSTSRPSSSSKPSASPSTEVKKGIPIIVLPTAVTAMLTMVNAKDFLEEGKFIKPADKKDVGAKKEESLLIMRTRNKNEPPVKYLVIDNPTKLQPKDWHRVVAVFSSGHAWQFKGWKWQNPTDLFANVRGFYLKYDDEKAPDLIRSWDVKVLNLSKTKRHLDPTTSLAFWQEIDEYIGHRSHLQQILRW